MKNKQSNQKSITVFCHTKVFAQGEGKERGVVGGKKKFLEYKLVHADLSTSYVAFSTWTAINSTMHKQTLPSSPKHFGTFDAGVLLVDKGLFPFFEPEI